ncbi:MAG: hypothetical protein GEU99_08855 [Luteitalea sp.]|nr:hypothetical protein [Luteitalea sp.]
MRRIRLFPRIDQDEVHLVWSLGLLHFLVILAFTLARIARDGVLLSTVSVVYLPHISVGLAFFTALAVHLFDRLSAGVSSATVLSRAALVTGLSLALFSVWFRQDGPAAAIVFYLWVSAYGVLLVAQFWIVANEQLNPGRARRLFGLIGAAGIFGGMVAGLVALQLGSVLSPQANLLVIAAVHLVMPLAVRGLARTEEGSRGAQPARAAAQGSTSALRSPYVRLLVVLFLVAGVTSGVLDYQFKYALQQRSTDAHELTWLLGLFNAAQNVLALLAGLGLSSLLLSRVGVRVTSGLLPVGLLLGSGVIFMWPLLAPVFGTRLYEATLRASITRSAREFLFFPLRDEVRARVKRFIESVIDRASDAVAGLLVLGLNAVLAGTILQLAALTAVLVAVWIAVELIVTRAYSRELSFSVERMLGYQPPPAPIRHEPEAVASLVSLLDSSRENHVLYALDRLLAIDPEAVRERVTDLLKHPSAAVRFRVMASPELNAAAVLRNAAVEAVPSVSSASDSGLPQGPSPETSVTHVRGLPDRDGLEALLDDPDPEVRRASFRLVAATRERSYVPTLIARLEHTRQRKDAREALASYGTFIVGTLGDYLVDPRPSLRVRREIPRVLATIGGQDAAHSLLRAADCRDCPILLQRTLWALNRIRKNEARLFLPRVTIARHLHEDVDGYLRLMIYRSPLNGRTNGSALRLLHRAVTERLDQVHETIFRRLALLYPPRDILRARRGLGSVDARLRTPAREYLDSILTIDDRWMLAPLVEEAAEAERVRAAALRLQLEPPSLLQVLRVLLAGPDVWLRACALFMIGSGKLDELTDLVEESLGARDTTVRETALWARARLSAG